VIKKANELVITSYVVVAFFLFLTYSYYISDLFNRATGSKKYLVFYQDSDLAFYAFWAVVLMFVVFFFNRFKSNEYSLTPNKVMSQSDIGLILFTLVLWTIPNFLFPGTDGSFPSNEVLYVNLLPALIEEVLFRGCLLLLFVQLFKKYHYGKMYSLVLMSLLFAFWHFSPMQFELNFPKLAIHFLGGLTLGFVFLRTKWLLPCVLIHYLGNISHFYFPYLRVIL
jgi:membrane protease YdiL (CAAX protease family)